VNAKNVVDQEIKTANYLERMAGLMDNADLFVFFRGGTGTLSEWATAWLLGSSPLWQSQTTDLVWPFLV
jgi:predicted Rossmann-fold nucleotide-binding protein